MTDQIKELAEMISNLGVTLILSAIVIFVIIKLLGYLFKWMDAKFQKKSHDEKIDIRNNVNIEIYKLLNAAMSKFPELNRIQVVEFSNSVMSVAHMPFKYMSCTYEVCNLGQKACGHLVDKISTSLFTPFFQQLQEAEYYIIDVDKSPESICGAMRDFLQQENATKSLCDMMVSGKGKSIGYVTMKKDTDFTQDEIDEIQSLSDRICSLLSILDK